MDNEWKNIFQTDFCKLVWKKYKKLGVDGRNTQNFVVRAFSCLRKKRNSKIHRRFVTESIIKETPVFAPMSFQTTNNSSKNIAFPGNEQRTF